MHANKVGFSEPEKGPLFLVGASRSGTQMMQSILNQHTAVGLANETHYFDDLRDRIAGQSDQPLTEKERAICIDYFRALAHRPYGMKGDPEKSDISRDEMMARARELQNGADAYFQAFCQICAERKGKRIWGEKTPRHIYRIDDMLGRYSQAKVICMVRDGRAVVTSYRDWRNQGGFDRLRKEPTFPEALNAEHRRTRQSYNIVNASLLWKASVNAALMAREKFGPDRVYVQRYEDLAQSPEERVRDLCAWLGIEYEPSMLDVPMHNSSFSQFARTAGVSLEPLDRWKEKLSEHEIATIQAVCGGVLKNAGYELLPVPGAPFSVGWELVKAPVAGVRAMLVNRHRTGNLLLYVWRRLLTAMG